MITYINSDNKQNYTVLFDMASAKLGLAPVKKEVGFNPDGTPIIENYKYVSVAGGGWDLVPCEDSDFDENGNFLIVKNNERVISTGINTLNEYFQNIEALSELAIGDGRTGSDPYFLRLPLDEPYFEINANTRGITVPGELSQIGVVGDKFAEVVFFRIDRYFDAVDLDTRHIYIEWELPDGTRGISRDFLRDTQSEKDKIIFGWLIDDVLTAQTGTIRFAVRFVEWTDRGDEANTNAQLLYSFSSLPATITVSDSLHYTLFEDDEELKYNTLNSSSAIATMRGIFENSDPDSETASALTPAAKPIFVRNLDVDATLLAEETYTRNLEGGAKNQPAGLLKLIAEAYTNDSGSIWYQFNYKATEDSGVEGLQTENYNFIEVSDHSDANRLYYIKKENDVFQPVTQTDIANLDGNVQIYERTASAVITKPGYYRVNARNRATGFKTNSANSFTLYIPYAAKPEITRTMHQDEENVDKPQRFVINQVDYTKFINPETRQSGAAATSNIEYNIESTGPATVTLAPTATASDGNSADQTENLSYQWYKSDDIYDVNMANAAMIEGATEATYEASAPGCYAVKINNHFNNDDTETELLDAGVCRVTAMPEVPVINWTEWEETIVAGRVNIPDLNVTVGDHDKVTYEWHKISADVEDEDPIATENMLQATGELTFVNGAASIPFKPLTNGRYYLILENQLNGASVFVNSAINYGVIYVEAQ